MDFQDCCIEFPGFAATMPPIGAVRFWRCEASRSQASAVAEVEESLEPPIDPKLFKELERSCEALVKKATKRAALLSKEAEDLDDDFI